jgi:hypothetical protein
VGQLWASRPVEAAPAAMPTIFEMLVGSSAPMYWAMAVIRLVTPKIFRFRVKVPWRSVSSVKSFSRTESSVPLAPSSITLR